VSRPGWFSETPDGVILRVLIQPRASRTEVVGLHGEPPRLKIRISAPPVDGAANDTVVEFLAKTLGCARRDIELIRGASSRKKDFLCRGVRAEKVNQLVAAP